MVLTDTRLMSLRTPARSGNPERALGGLGGKACRCAPRQPKRQRTTQAFVQAERDLDGRTSWEQQGTRHVLESQQFSRASLDLVFSNARQMENIRPGSAEAKQLDGYVMSTLFYEPSTRTRLSFESAMAKLGGQVVSTENAGQYSSAAKGETLEGAVSICTTYFQTKAALSFIKWWCRHHTHN